MDKFNYNYFESVDTEAKAYFLGFIVADGDISRTTNRVSFTLHKKDKYILEILKKDINSPNMVREYSVFDNRTQKFYERTVFQFSNFKIKKDLKTLGVDEDKSKSFKEVYIDDRYFWHFLRGMIDGDGSINDTRLQVTLISTYQFLEKLVEYLKNYDIKLSKKFFCLNKEKNTWRISIQGDKNVNRLLEKVYENSSIKLQRKYDNFLKQKEITKNLSHGIRIKKVEVLNRLTNAKVNEFNTVKECMKHYKLSTTQFYYREHPDFIFKTGEFQKTNIKYNEEKTDCGTRL